MFMYQMTQKKQIKAAKTAYVVTLKSTTKADCFAVYLQGVPGYETLQPLWPFEEERKNLLPHQVHSKNLRFPAYFFRVSEVGSSRVGILASVLRDINPKLRIEHLSGGVPSSC